MRDNPRPKRAKVHKPFPDAIASGYAVVKGQGGLSFDEKTMHVPLGESDYERMIRLHEMGHLKFTPDIAPDKVCRKHGVKMEFLQVCEDARVNTLLERHAGLPMSRLGATEDLGPWRDDLLKMMEKDKRTAIREAAVARVAFQSRNAAGMEEMLRNIGLNEAVTAAKAALRHLPYKGRGIPFTKTIKAAKALETALDAGDQLADSPGDLKEIGDYLRENSGRADFVPWGKMTVETPLLAVRRKSKILPKYRATDSGLRIRSCSRILTDRRPFGVRRTKQVQGGSLLIDGSGSMHLSPDDVRNMLAVAPLAWIGIYAGTHSDKGVVKVLARDGVVVRDDDMDSPGGLNVIDGPALRLLAQQSAPRIWICDGYVTGQGDQTSVGNVAECAQICTEANIKRIDNAPAAIEYMKTLTAKR